MVLRPETPQPHPTFPIAKANDQRSIHCKEHTRVVSGQQNWLFLMKTGFWCWKPYKSNLAEWPFSVAVAVGLAANWPVGPPGKTSFWGFGFPLPDLRGESQQKKLLP